MNTQTALELAFMELMDVQFIDNTSAEGRAAEEDVRQIMRRLVERITKPQRSPEEERLWELLVRPAKTLTQEEREEIFRLRAFVQEEQKARDGEIDPTLVDNAGNVYD